MISVMDYTWSKYPKLMDEIWLRDQYVGLKKTTIEIADEIGCSSGTVSYRLNQYGVKMRGRHSDNWNDKECQTCSKTFTPSGPAALYCSAECREGTAVCEQCGDTFIKRQLNKKKGATDNRFCSKTCRYNNVRAQPGYGRYMNSEGYVAVADPRKLIPSLHRGVNTDGYVRINLGKRVLEHRLVMEQNLGRKLRSDETVHHINGDKQDNRLENLQLRQGKHGTGEVAVCLDCHSYNIGHEPLKDAATMNDRDY